jgi:hypothetical protein
MRDVIVIVHDEMDVEFARHGGLDLVEELTELGSTVASIALADDPSGRNIEGGEQRCGAVPRVVMASSGRLAGTEAVGNGVLRKPWSGGEAAGTPNSCGVHEEFRCRAWHETL